MNEPIKLQILKALSSHLSGITPQNNFEFDLSNSVFRGRTVFGDSDPIPMLSILEAPRNVDGTRAGENDRYSYGKFGLMIQGWVKDDKINPTDPAYYLAETVVNRLREIIALRPGNSGQPLNPDVYLLGNLIAGLTIGEPIIRPPIDNLSSRAFFYLHVDVSLAT